MVWTDLPCTKLFHAVQCIVEYEGFCRAFVRILRRKRIKMLFTGNCAHVLSSCQDQICMRARMKRAAVLFYQRELMWFEGARGWVWFHPCPPSCLPPKTKLWENKKLKIHASSAVRQVMRLPQIMLGHGLCIRPLRRSCRRCVLGQKPRHCKASKCQAHVRGSHFTLVQYTSRNITATCGL